MHMYGGQQVACHCGRGESGSPTIQPEGWEKRACCNIGIAESCEFQKSVLICFIGQRRCAFSRVWTARGVAGSARYEATDVDASSLETPATAVSAQIQHWLQLQGPRPVGGGSGAPSAAGRGAGRAADRGGQRRGDGGRAAARHCADAAGCATAGLRPSPVVAWFASVWSRRRRRRAPL